MLIEKGGKKFEKPDAGVFGGTIVDIVDLGMVANKNPEFAPSLRVRIIWVLDKNDSEGKPYRIMEQPTQKLSDGSGKFRKSRLYEIVEGVTGQAPSFPFDPETLLGRSNNLFLAKEGEYTNIKGFMPLNPGQVAPKAPADFVRDKDKPKTQASTAQAQAAVQQRTANPASNNGNPQTPQVAAATDEDIPF